MNGKIFLKKVTWILIFVVLLTNIPVYAKEYEDSNIRCSNGFIQYIVDKEDGRFIIRTDEGVPFKEKDSDKKLLFDKNNDPETSFTSFLIDGEEYIYGNDYGFMDKISSFVQKPTNIGKVNTSIWNIKDIQIKQIISLEDDLDHPNVGNVKIRYEMVNKSSKDKKVGSRILLDTMLGDNDGAAFVLGNNIGDIITKETVLMGDTIPSYWRCSDDLFAPTVISYGFTKGWGNPAPDKMIMAHWSNISETKWSYNVDRSMDFTDSNNELGAADSAAALYWNEKTIKAGERMVFETYYGLGNLRNYNSNSSYKVKLIAPKTLTVNEDKDGYGEDEITVTAEIDNSLSDSVMLTNVKANLVTKVDGFELVDGEKSEITIPLINKGEIKTVSWKIKPLSQDNYISEPIKVEIVSDNNVQPVMDVEYILMPSIQGTPPEIQILSIAPQKIFYEGDKYLSIKGNGFEYFYDKSLWKMYFVDELGNEYLIPKESIDVASDSIIKINLLEEQVEGTMPTGVYSIRIDHYYLDEPMFLPSDKRIEFTSDEAYRSRSYGVLYVEKRLKEDKYYYYINTVSSKEELDTLKIYVKENEEAPNGYEDIEDTEFKGKLVDIVFDIIGNIEMTTDQATGMDKYTINTNQTNAIINSVIQFKDARQPIEIKKVDDLIVLKGKGTLQLLNYGEVWWSSFETYISDEENYVGDEIIEEDEEDDEEDKSNIEISLFDPLSLIAAGTSLFIDGFELELKDIILLDEGASLGGKLAVEIPIGKKDKKAKETTTDTNTEGNENSNKNPDEELTEEEKQEKLEEELGEAMRELFMTEEEKEEETFEAMRNMFDEEEEKAEEFEKQRQEEARKAILDQKAAKRKRNAKLRAVLINDDEIGPEIISLFKKDIPTRTKVETVLNLIFQSSELVTKIVKIIKEQDDEDDDEDDDDETQVGVAIDVKKVVFGKKYGEDFIYNDVKYIGIDGSGEVNIELPGIEVGDEEKEQGISAELVVNTLEGIYSIDADVDIKVAEAHAFITIMRFKEDEPGAEYKYLLDDLVLSGGYVPGIPIVPPVFISEVGGGAEDLYGVISNDGEAPPMKVVIILGLNIVPAFQGDFRLEVSKRGFTLDGALAIKKMEILKQARVEIQWARPIYLALAAELEAFEIIEGEVSIYIGEIETGHKDKPYKFYFEGTAQAEISIPEKVPFAGGITLTGVDLGVSTIKLWGSLNIGFIPLGITWVYDEGVEFGQTIDGNKQYVYASLTDVVLPDDYWHFYDVYEKEQRMKMIVGDNISVIGSSKNKYQYAIASLDNYYVSHSCVLVANDNKVHRFDFQGNEIGLIELKFDDSIPNLTVTDPEGNIYSLVSIEDDPTNGNYRVQIIPADKSSSGNKENYVYIGVKNPMPGYYEVRSDVKVDSKLMSVEVPPGFNSITMEQEQAADKLNITWDAHHADNSLVSLFLVKEEESESAGYAVASNLQGISGSTGVQVDIPTGLQEGNYKLRATIQNPDYGYETRVSDDFIRIVDNNKPAEVTELSAETYGNGFIRATWDAVEEDGDISYFATVYDAKENSIENFTDYEVTENKVVFGGQYKNKLTGEIIKLDTDKEYIIGITAKKVLNHDDGTQTIHIGEEVLSNKVFLKTPEPPSIITTFKNDPIVIQSEDIISGKNVSQLYFNSNIVEMNFATDQEDVNTTVYLDGEYFLDFNKKEYQLYFDLVDGKHKVEFISENNDKNIASKTINFNIDTTAPELLVDYPLPGFISDNEIVDIRGTAENSCIVSINGRDIPLDSKDIFTYQYLLNKNKLKDEIVIEARDAVGNTTVYSTEVVNGMVKNFKNIYIRPTIEEMVSGTKTKFTVIGIDDSGKEIEIDSKNVEWSLLEGNVLADVNDEGILTAIESGDVVLKASYYISDGYSYDDAVEFKITDNIEYIYRMPNVSFVEVGQEVNFTLYEVSKYDEDFVDNSIVTWTITSGNEFGQIDEYGHFNALKKGKVIIQGSYIDKFGNDQKLAFEIEVLEKKQVPHYNHSTNNSDVDKAIEEIWRKLIEKESNIKIVDIEDLKAGEERKISIRGMVEIQIPADALKNNDQIFIGNLNNPERLINPEDYKLYGDIIELQLKEAQGHLNKPIKVTFKYRDSEITNIDNLDVYYYNPKFENWEPIGGTVDSESGTISVELNHLSKYAVLERNKDIPKVMPDKEWTIKFNSRLDKSTINNENIFVLDSTGNSKAVTFEYDESKKSLKIIPKGYYEESKIYYLCMNKKLLSENKARLNEELKYMFQVADYGLTGKRISDKTDVAPEKQFTIKLNQPICDQQLSNKINVVDETGNLFPVTLKPNTKKDEIIITTKSNYTEGETYYILIDNLLSTKGKVLKEKTWMKIKIREN